MLLRAGATEILARCGDDAAPMAHEHIISVLGRAPKPIQTGTALDRPRRLGRRIVIAIFRL